MRYLLIAAGLVILLFGAGVFVGPTLLYKAARDSDPVQLSQSGPNTGLSLHFVNARVTLEEALAKGVPSDSIIMESRDSAEQYLVMLEGQALGPHIADAAAVVQGSRPVVSVRLDATGAKIFGELSTKGIGRRLAIVLDGKVYSAPTIQSPVYGGSIIITGSFSVKEAEDLARELVNSR